MENEIQDLQLIIRKELENHKPVVSANLIRWFIGTFGVVIILLAVNAGIFLEKFATHTIKIKALEDHAISQTSWVYNEYRTNFLWAERWGQQTPSSPNQTRGGSSASER